jgi:abortive infection bacteriophage resistance protein
LDPKGVAVTPLKPWRSLREQLETLKSRGLHVDDESAALDYLARIGYYRLSGYWYPLRVIDPVASKAEGKAVRLDDFVPGSRFEDVVRLYVFDKKLRLLALDALERIEMGVRVDVAHLLGQREPLAHLKPECLHGNFAKRRIAKGRDAGKTEHQLWVEKFESLLHRARKEPFVEHHQKKYGVLPIWAAIEVWDFGQLSKLFAGLRYSDQQAVAEKYRAPSGEAFGKWLRTLNFLRNVSAHHSRLWNINVLEVSPVPRTWPQELKNTRPFFPFCLMQVLVRTLCPNSSWGSRFVDLVTHEFPAFAHTGVTIADLGAYPGWTDWDLWPQAKGQK